MLEDSMYTLFTDFWIEFHEKPNIAVGKYKHNHTLEKRSRVCLTLKSHYQENDNLQTGHNPVDYFWKKMYQSVCYYSAFFLSY